MKAAVIRPDRLSDGGRLFSQCVVSTLQKKGVAVKCGSRPDGGVVFSKRKWREHRGSAARGLSSTGVSAFVSRTDGFFSDDFSGRHHYSAQKRAGLSSPRCIGRSNNSNSSSSSRNSSSSSSNINSSSSTPHGRNRELQMMMKRNLMRLFLGRPAMLLSSSSSGVLVGYEGCSSSSLFSVASRAFCRGSGTQYHRGIWSGNDRREVVGVSARNRVLSTRARKADLRPPASTVDGDRDEVYSPEEKRRKERQKALEAAMSEINAVFGKGSVQKLGAVHSAFVETVPTGCMTLDWVLGGGLPRGRIVEIYGPESSGKTTLALHAIAQVQKRGGNAMLVDAEHAFDAVYSRNLGVDNENLIVCQPDSGEMALETADRMCRSGAVDLICIDSVSALTPKAEIEGEIGMQQMGLQARLMSQAMRKMSTNASKANCTLIFLNQIRNKVGVVYGSPEVTSGGLALRFFASVRLDVRPIGKLKSSKQDDEVGIRVRVRVKKSKVSRPYRVAEMDLVFGEGVSTVGCVLDCAEAFGVISRKGSWYSFGELSIGQGRDRAIQHLKENDEMLQTIEQIVRQKIAQDSGKEKGAQAIGVGGILVNGGEDEDEDEDEEDVVNNVSRDILDNVLVVSD